MAETYKEVISEQQFRQTTYCMLALPTVFILFRIGIQIRTRKTLEPQDYLVYAAFIFFLAMCICYLVVIARVYMVGKVSVGVMEPWATMQEDILVYLRMMFVTTVLFWLALWFVKFSLLVLYRKVMEGLPGVYMRLWWGVVGFCVVVSVAFVQRYGMITDVRN